MSAFVVSRRTMDRCVTAILASGEFTFAGFSLTTPNMTRRETARRIGRALYDMNVRAVMARYLDTVDDPEKMPGEEGAASLPATYTPERINVAEQGAQDGIKALVCLRYQCSEGDIPESDLYRELDSIISRLALRLVSRHPAYEAAAWDS